MYEGCGYEHAGSEMTGEEQEVVRDGESRDAVYDDREGACLSWSVTEFVEVTMAASPSTYQQSSPPE